MSVNSTIPKETNHSTSTLRFLELEAGFKKHEELVFKTLENFSRQLNVIKSNQVNIFFVFKPLFLLTKTYLKIKKKGKLGESSAPVTNKLDEVKKEIRGFTSLHGFSTVLNTSNPFVKFLWVFFFIVLFSGCIQNVFENMSDYYEYTAITKIEYVKEYPMTMPAVTLCLASFQSLSTNATLDKSLYNCEISGAECNYTDFHPFEAIDGYRKSTINCYVLNGGRNSTGHPSEIKSTRNSERFAGFLIRFILPKYHYLFYYISDAYVKPTKSEIDTYLIPGTYTELKLEKTIETKLEYPFNNCWNRINLPDTSLIRQLSEANITYRQVNCFELCFQNFVQKYAFEHNISATEAREKDEVQNYDKEKNCNKLCPLECENTQYKIAQSVFTLADFSDSEEYSLRVIPLIKKKLNITVNSTEEFNKNCLVLKISFDSLKYTKISQTPKTGLSALVSNLGGSTGLFLDLSFMSACRAIEFLISILFKF